MEKRFGCLVGLITISLFLFSCVPQTPEVAKKFSVAENFPAPAVEDIPARLETAAEVPVKMESKSAEPEFELIYPNLTYDNAYNGPLFDTSLQIGSDGDMDKYFENFDRNGMNFFIGYFKIDYPPEQDILINNKGLGYALYAAQRHPYRIVPYISLSKDAEEVPEILGSEMTGLLRSNLDAVREIAGQDFVKGFGELEVMDYAGYRVNSRELMEIYDLAKEKNILVMFHPKAGEVGRVKEVIEKYPDMKFLIHLFRTDFKTDRDAYIDLIKTHDNLFFSVDVDHMMFLPKESVGMLYQYEEDRVKDAAFFFVSGFNDVDETSLRYLSLVNSAIVDYKPLIEAAPTKIMWGTEMGPKYNFEPEVYDLIIKFSRLFIGKLDSKHQEAFAYKNALRVFGSGVKIDSPLPITDAAGWPECTAKQSTSCEEESDVCGKVDTPENGLCIDKCLFELKCYTVED